MSRTAHNDYGGCFDARRVGIATNFIGNEGGMLADGQDSGRYVMRQKLTRNSQ
jgi:hypothetical protein